MISIISKKKVSLIWVMGLVLSLGSCAGEGFKMLSEEPPFLVNEFSVTNIESLGNTTVKVTFSSPLAASEAQKTAYYSANQGLTISEAELGEVNTEVLLTTSAQDEITYTVIISGMKSLGGEKLAGGKSVARFEGKKPVAAGFAGKPEPFGTDTSFEFRITGDYNEAQAYRFYIKKWDGTSETDVSGGSLSSPVSSWQHNWSAAMDIAQPIQGTLPNTPAGQTDNYRIYVIVQDQYGAWQNTADATMYQWSVDNAPPAAAQFGQKPEPKTNFTTVAMTVGDLLCSETGDVPPCNSQSDVVYYKYAVSEDGGSTWTPSDWASATERNVSENIILSGLANGETYRVRLLARDFAGNWQTEAVSDPNTGPGDDDWYALHSSQEISFAVDTTPPVASAVGGTLPPTPSNSLNTITIQVDDADAVAYKYKLTGPDNSVLTYNGEWSPELDPSTTDIYETNLASAGAGSYTLLMAAKDEAGNWQELTNATTYTWSFDPNEPTAELDWNGNPPNFRTNETDFTISVQGVGITHYKYDIIAAPEGDKGGSCVGASYSAETPVSTDINLTSGDFVDDRYHTLCVIGKNTEGTWQQTSDSKVSKRTWAYDISAPTADISQWVNPGLAPNNTTLSNFTFLVGGLDPRPGEDPSEVNDVVEYKYKVASDCSGGGYSEAYGIGTSVNLNLGYGTNKICLVVRDSSGNWQSATDATENTINIITTPTPSRPAAHVYPSGSPKSVEFSWSNPAGVTDVKIQIARDPSFTNIVPGYTVGKTLGDVQSFSYPSSGGIEAALGTTYYARLKIKDNLGNWSQWGPASDGVTITGGLSGTVKDVTGAAVDGANVVLKNKAGDSTLASTTTNGSGEFDFVESHQVPITTAAEGYQIAVDKGSQVGGKSQLAVSAGSVTHVGNTYIVDPGVAQKDIVGKVASAENGTLLSLSNVTISLYKWDGTLVTRSYVAEDGGLFRFADVAGGAYYIEVEKPGYYSFIKQDIRQDGSGEVNVGTVPLCPEFTAGSKSIKVVLIWNDRIDDLDLHVVGPDGSGSRMHVYYQKRFFNAGGNPAGTTKLAIDSTMYYGPEVINLRDGYADGSYKFSVHKYSQASQAWSQGNVRVLVYAGDYYDNTSGGLVHTFVPSIPPSGSETYATWKGFVMEIGGSSLSFKSNASGPSRTTDEFVDWTNDDVSGSVSYDTSNCSGEVPCVFNDNGLSNLDWTW